VFILLLALQAQAYEFMLNEAGSSLKWDEDAPVTYKVESERGFDAIEGAFRHGMTSSAAPLSFSASSPG
jgi:hypothetical protein